MAKKTYIWNEFVPTDRAENIRFRMRLLKACEHPVIRASVMQACKEDVLFFFNAFCWLFEKRPERTEQLINKDAHEFPLIVWPHQIPGIKLIDEHIGYRDVGEKKSRDEGVTWLHGLLMILHRWLFLPGNDIGIMAKDEELVDSTENTNALMRRLDWELDKLPEWMVPPLKKDSKDGDWARYRSYQQHVLKNKHNGNTVKGFPCTPNVASGERYTYFFCDEVAKWPRGDQDVDSLVSLQSVTESRFICSTYYGSPGAYEKAMADEESNMVRIVTHWSDNPVKNKGLYEYRDGDLRAIDGYGGVTDAYRREFHSNIGTRLERRGFNLEAPQPFFAVKFPDAKGRIGSPWYDNECLRTNSSPQSIAQEQDIDPSGSTTRFYPIALLDHLIATSAEPRKLKGNLSFRMHEYPNFLPPRFSKDNYGPLTLWTDLILSDNPYPPANIHYVIGVDISSGASTSATSYSVAAVMERETRRVVAELKANYLEPKDFADYVIALAHWFRGLDDVAYVVPEANGGYGTMFMNRMRSRGFRRIYRRYSDRKDGARTKRTQQYGYWSQGRTKFLVHGQLRDALDRGECTILNAASLEEAKAYVVMGDEQVEYMPAMNCEDPNDKGQNHGDTVTAIAMALEGAEEHGKPFSREQSREEQPGWGSIAMLRQQGAVAG